MNGSIILGGTTTTNIVANSPIQATAKLTVADIDVGQTLKLFLFFLQSRHPEVFDEFYAIEKIKKS